VALWGGKRVPPAHYAKMVPFVAIPDENHVILSKDHSQAVVMANKIIEKLT